MGTNPERVRAGRTLSEDEEAVQRVGVRIEESAGESRSVTVMQLDDSGFADFIAAGTQISGDFRCADCGYGAVVRGALPQCPMCAGTVWESRGHRS
jgi:rubrerythrin